jgi:hypothetical protein
MRVDAALVREQGVEFAVVSTKPWVLNDSVARERFRSVVSSRFDCRPTVLMAQDSQGIPSYHGRADIVRFLANMPLELLPWRRWHLN